MPPNPTALKSHLLGKAPDKRQRTQDQPVPSRQSRDIVRREQLIPRWQAFIHPSRD
jgi:hypothetical protein